MKNYIKKHPAAVAILAVAVVSLFGLAYTQRQRVLSNPTEKNIADGPRASAPCENDFYYNQLNEKEQEAYHTMLQHLKDKEGGVTELPSPLTGKEYMRVLSALENSSGQYFYGLFEIPMTDEDFYVRYEERDLTRIIDPIIAKVILFQSFSNGLDVPGEYDDRGRVSNLSEINTLLSQNDPEKLKKIEEKEAEIEACLTEILSGLPEEAGEKEAVDYFLSWMDKNLELNTEIGVNAFQFNSMTEVLDQAYIYNNLSCVLEKKASISGFNKLLAELCRRSGIPAYVVQGVWGRQKTEAYELCAVTLGETTYYVDASKAKGEDFGNQRYLTGQEAQNHMTFVEYFTYAPL